MIDRFLCVGERSIDRCLDPTQARRFAAKNEPSVYFFSCVIVGKLWSSMRILLDYSKKWIIFWFMYLIQFI